MAATIRRRVAVFLAIFVLLNIPIHWYFLTHPPSSMKLLGLVVMWSPGIAAIATKLWFDRSLANLGWGWGRWRYQLLSYLLPIACMLVVYGLVWMLGVGELSIRQFTTLKNQSVFGTPDRLPFPQLLLFQATVWVALGTIFTLGEEIGWRGFLLPELTKAMSYTRASFLVGLTWGLWHVPGILFLGYNAGTPPAWAIPCFVAMIVSLTFIMNWIRLRSGSLWTAVVLHASHNVFIQSVFELLTRDRPKTRYVTTEFGIGMALVYALVAYLFWRRRGALPTAAAAPQR